MTGISTHILDTGTGYPATGVPVSLERQNADGWSPVGEGITNDDGRITSLASEQENLEAGVYRLQFAIESYFQKQEVNCFYPEVTVVFKVSDDRHHHIPLLLSTYGYSTYRGS
ncbi:hydroxyisourate hydrolase [Endozoicomonas euniceicola]|uniref:5-hydroxyisourate hydrolase n=1 Tax=Endozoicomonas euniceicola TaxID=1234143 RepID=A0ABY6GVF0_9GAMM|nr:hydroxyisourate hydrolase [Endozoicomonas euniceicola]UYM16748.1 hydroxyisourate hydrolase [Endozoicomonas euniceicola]